AWSKRHSVRIGALPLGRPSSPHYSGRSPSLLASKALGISLGEHYERAFMPSQGPGVSGTLFRSGRPPVLSRPLVLLPERSRSADPSQHRAAAAFVGDVGPGIAEGCLPTHALEGCVRRSAQESAEGATKRRASARTRQVIGEDLVVGGLEHLGHAVRPGALLGNCSDFAISSVQVFP